MRLNRISKCKKPNSLGVKNTFFVIYFKNLKAGFKKMVKNKPIKALFKGIRIVVLAFLTAMAIYFFVAITLSVIPVNSKPPMSTPDKYKVFVSSNGVHIDIVLPASDSIVNWFEKIKFEEKIQPFIRYLSFGWGNKEFYIHTPEWSDLTF